MKRLPSSGIAADAKNDLQAVRAMIDAGSGYPPHWRGGAPLAAFRLARCGQAVPVHHLAVAEFRPERSEGI